MLSYDSINCMLTNTKPLFPAKETGKVSVFASNDVSLLYLKEAIDESSTLHLRYKEEWQGFLKKHRQRVEDTLARIIFDELELSFEAIMIECSRVTRYANFFEADLTDYFHGDYLILTEGIVLTECNYHIQADSYIYIPSDD